MSIEARPFDNLIGRLDRILSELVHTAKHGKLDAFDTKTMEHHAEDMVGAGLRILELIGSGIPPFIYERVLELAIPVPQSASSSSSGSAPMAITPDMTPAERDEWEGENLRRSLITNSPPAPPSQGELFPQDEVPF